MKICFTAFVVLSLCDSAAIANVHTVVSIDYCARTATHIVLVRSQPRMDGQVTVLESLRGNLKPGESLVIPSLAKFRSDESRHIECLKEPARIFAKCPPGTPQFVTGTRMVLFLKLRDHPITDKWWPIGFVWIERGQVYGLWDGEEPPKAKVAVIGTERAVRVAIGKLVRQKATRGMSVHRFKSHLGRHPFVIASVDPDCGMCTAAKDEMKHLSIKLAGTDIRYFLVSFTGSSS